MQNIFSRLQEDRAIEALIHVLPRVPGINVERADPAWRDLGVDLVINEVPVQLKWAGEGWLQDVRPILGTKGPHLLIVAARRMSPGARKALQNAEIGWVDETGAAEICAGPIVISRDSRPTKPIQNLTRWTPAVQSVAEALLCGTPATVAMTQQATGLSAGSCTNALRFLTTQKLLAAPAPRGPNSARNVPDFDQFLSAYASAVAETPSQTSVQVGVMWRDPVAGLSELGEIWDQAGIAWACSGAVAASVLAPYLSAVSTADVYVDAKTQAGLEAAAAEVRLHPIAGGRLTLRPFPTTAARLLRTRKQHLHVVPWPRVYADLRTIGVRGEEAAEHLREIAYAE